MRKSAATIALVAVAALALVPPAFARGGSSSSSFGGGGGRGWVGGTQKPEDFPNCMMWSQKDRAYVWLCGKPYPPGYIHR
ncbi:MAG: hypothetical protein KDJ86_17555 [Bauldia sp.]|uniref:hypothetical protein n=1 Tax=Bauldia sp. TaxID=2575872 RepID=UPI001D471DAC|nr:hypothetical protein [Bauldia sp.]MCB1497591.1 hypothetical protein [Bauldia sp.]